MASETLGNFIFFLYEDSAFGRNWVAKISSEEERQSPIWWYFLFHQKETSSQHSWLRKENPPFIGWKFINWEAIFNHHLSRICGAPIKSHLPMNSFNPERSGQPSFWIVNTYGVSNLVLNLELQSSLKEKIFPGINRGSIWIERLLCKDAKSSTHFSTLFTTNTLFWFPPKTSALVLRFPRAQSRWENAIFQ